MNSTIRYGYLSLNCSKQDDIISTDCSDVVVNKLDTFCYELSTVLMKANPAGSCSVEVYISRSDWLDCGAQQIANLELLLNTNICTRYNNILSQSFEQLPVSVRNNTFSIISIKVSQLFGLGKPNIIDSIKVGNNLFRVYELSTTPGPGGIHKPITINTLESSYCIYGGTLPIKLMFSTLLTLNSIIELNQLENNTGTYKTDAFVLEKSSIITDLEFVPNSNYDKIAIVSKLIEQQPYKPHLSHNNSMYNTNEDKDEINTITINDSKVTTYDSYTQMFSDSTTHFNIYMNRNYILLPAIALAAIANKIKWKLNDN